MTVTLNRKILKSFEVDVPAGTNEVGDSIQASQIASIEYNICIEGGSKRKTIKMSVIKEAGGGFNHNVSSVLGSVMEVVPNFSLYGSEGRLTLVNSETFPVVVKISRMLIS